MGASLQRRFRRDPLIGRLRLWKRFGVTWSRLIAHMETLPTTNGIAIEQAGFPDRWDQLPLWQ
jgi:hypothetical protein